MATEHRLHISGLTPAVTPSDLKERFQRYGNVKAVDTVGLDALGQPRNFVYLTIDAEQQSLTKCINSMQNSIWRGAKLKIAPAKKSYEDRLATERLTDIERKALLNEKEARKLRIKERKDRKRRLAKAGGGRQSGDMRLMTEENWKNDGDIWRGKYWHLTPTHHLIRPIYTRPTHPLHMKPVSTASEKVEPLPTTKKTDQFEELATLGKKVKKPRSLPPKRAMRMLLDPFRYGHMHLNGAILEGAAASEVASLPDGRWSFTYDDLRLDEISSRLDPSLVGGTWTFHPAGDTEVTSSGEQNSTNIEVVPGKRKRVADQLNEIAGNSAFPDTVQDVVNKNVVKKSKIGPSGGKGNKASFEDPHVLRLDDDDIPTLDDDDIWGAAPVTTEKESVSLFDSNPASTGAVSQLRPPTKLVSVIAASSDEEDANLSDVEFDDDDALFGATNNDVAAPASPLFEKKASRDQAQTPSDVIEDDSTDETTRRLSTGVGTTLGGFARAEKEKGLSVLQKLGIDLSKDEESPQPKVLNAVAFDDSEDEAQTMPQTSTKVDSAAWLYDDEDEDDDEPIETFRSVTRRLSESGAQEEPAMGDNSSDSGSSSDSHVDGDAALLFESAAEQIDARHALDGAQAPVKTAGNGTEANSETKATSSSTAESSDDTSDESGQDSSEDEGNGKQSSGNGNSGKGNGGNDGGKDGDDTDSDSDSSSEEDDSSSDDEDEEEAAGDKQKPAKQNTKQEKQSLKDMFAAQPEATTGFSLMAGLDLELDSDLEMDEANPFEAAAPLAREVESTLTSFAPVPAVDVNAVFNASSSNEPFFFGTTGRPLARTEDLQDGWMSKITVGGLEKEEVDVEPFWQTETDEQMAQLWNEQKRELTKEYKKRHREAVKRQKRGMGGAGPSADGGGSMDVE